MLTSTLGITLPLNFTRNEISTSRLIGGFFSGPTSKEGINLVLEYMLCILKFTGVQSPALAGKRCQVKAIEEDFFPEILQRISVAAHMLCLQNILDSVLSTFSPKGPLWKILEKTLVASHGQLDPSDNDGLDEPGA